MTRRALGGSPSSRAIGPRWRQRLGASRPEHAARYETQWPFGASVAVQFVDTSGGRRSSRPPHPTLAITTASSATCAPPCACGACQPWLSPLRSGRPRAPGQPRAAAFASSSARPCACARRRCARGGGETARRNGSRARRRPKRGCVRLLGHTQPSQQRAPAASAAAWQQYPSRTRQGCRSGRWCEPPRRRRPPQPARLHRRRPSPSAPSSTRRRPPPPPPCPLVYRRPSCACPLQPQHHGACPYRRTLTAKPRMHVAAREKRRFNENARRCSATALGPLALRRCCRRPP